MWKVFSFVLQIPAGFDGLRCNQSFFVCPDQQWTRVWLKLSKKHAIKVHMIRRNNCIISEIFLPRATSVAISKIQSNLGALVNSEARKFFQSTSIMSTASFSSSLLLQFSLNCYWCYIIGARASNYNCNM